MISTMSSRDGTYDTTLAVAGSRPADRCEMKNSGLNCAMWMQCEIDDTRQQCGSENTTHWLEPERAAKQALEPTDTFSRRDSEDPP
jgi:hypothetical protein